MTDRGYICEECAQRRGAKPKDQRFAAHWATCPICEEMTYCASITDFKWPFPKIRLKDA